MKEIRIDNPGETVRPYRDPLIAPSSMSARSIAKAEARRAALERTEAIVLGIALTLAAVTVGIIVMAFAWRRLVGAALIACLLVGCGADPVKVSALDREIASLTSMALMPGPRSDYESKKIAADGSLASQHLHEIAGK